MSLLLPEVGLLFWMTLSFGIVLFILIKFGFPVITGAIEKRHQYIQKALESAQEAEKQLASINEQAKAMMANAQKERNILLKEAQDIKDGIVAKAQQGAEEQARQRLLKAQIEIEEWKHVAMDQIMGEVAGISLKIAGKVLGETLSNDEQQKKLVNRLLEEELSYNHHNG